MLMLLHLFEFYYTNALIALHTLSERRGYFESHVSCQFLLDFLV